MGISEALNPYCPKCQRLSSLPSSEVWECLSDCDRRGHIDRRMAQFYDGKNSNFSSQISIRIHLPSILTQLFVIFKRILFILEQF